MKSGKVIIFIVFIATVLTSCTILGKVEQRELKVASIFNSYMVLQQNKPVSIWGWGTPGEKVTVKFAGQTKDATADADGKWLVTLAKMKANIIGQKMVISTQESKRIFADILIGEVWICSGQSNMEWPLEKKIAGGPEAIAQATYPNLRLFHLQRKASLIPQSDCNGKWTLCTPETAGKFSATAFFFGRKLIKELKDIPVGLIMTAWGGTPVESWTSLETLSNLDQTNKGAAKIKSLRELDSNKVLSKKYLTKLSKWGKRVVAKIAKKPSSSLKWSTMNCPNKWSATNLNRYTGTVCFKKTVTIPESWKGKTLSLDLGAIDDMDITLFNGKFIGITDNWATPREYLIPANLVHNGKNEIIVYVINSSGEGGLMGPSDKMKLYPSNKQGEAIPLTGAWQYSKQKTIGTLPPKPKNINTGVKSHTYSSLYNGMIYPLIPLSMRGAIWYQGESNSKKDPKLYAESFPAMVKNWREEFKQGSFPFYYVQIAPFNYTKGRNGVGIREAQRECLNIIPNSGMACIMDKATVKNIHPPYKTEVGDRLALWALAKIYNKNVIYSGPLLKKVEIDSNEVTVTFDHAEGLTSQKKKLLGFELKDSKGKWYKAQAKIKGKAIIVTATEVQKPVAVRYAWYNASTATLWNGAGLPASSFNSDW